MRVCLFEDHLVSGFEPLTLTRPIFDLLCGCTTLAEKQARFFAATSFGLMVRPELVETAADDPLSGRPTAPVNDLEWLWSGSSVVMINGRWLPPAPSPLVMPDPQTPCVGLVDDEVAYAIVPSNQLGDCAPVTLTRCLDRWQSTLPTRSAGGRLVRHLWDLVDANASEIALDAWFAAPNRPRKTTDLPALVGPADRLHVEPSARIDPMVVADTTGGPVVIDQDAVITAFTRLEGPCYIGPGTQVFGARVRAGSSFGPQCRIGGEVEASIVLGCSNKYHEGFLGHAYVGEWVNLGAGTHNSDLRNDYGEVSVTVNGQEVRSGRNKVGCFLGDHTKTGLGALLNTGTSAGAFSMLLPTGGLLPRYVPSFTSVWNGSLRENTDLHGLLRTATTVMSRRGRTLTPALQALYESILDQTAAQRRQAIRDAEVRRLRRSA